MAGEPWEGDLPGYSVSCTKMNKQAFEELEARATIVKKAMGDALWEVQGVEQMIAKYYAVAFKLSTSPSPEDIAKEFEKSFTNTAGRLIGYLREAAKEKGKDVAADRLAEFVKERNWLAHNIRRCEYLAMRDELHFKSVLQRLERLRIESIAIVKLFHEKMIEYFESLGASRQSIEEKHSKELDRVFGS